MSNFKKAWQELKKGAPREVGILLFMVIFGLCFAAVLVPIVWLASFLPEWVLWTIAGTWILWVVLEDTLKRVWAAFQGNDE